MYGERNELFELVLSFQKLKFSSILPDITPGEMMILTRIVCCGREHPEKEVHVSDVVSAAKILPPAVSRSLRNLEERGYLVRMVDKKDRRNTYVKLTDAGECVLREAHTILQEFGEAVTGRMGEREMRRLTEYLWKLYQTASEEIQKRDYGKRKADISSVSGHLFPDRKDGEWNEENH